MKKFVSKILIAALLIAVLLPVRVFADTEVAFELQVDGTGAVTLVSSNAKDAGISSLQFSLTVSGASAAGAEFAFSENVKNTAKVFESRYDQGTKTLNVYISGTKALFADGATRLNVGKAVAYDAAGNKVAASVSAVAGSVKYVYGEELKSQSTPTPIPTPTPTPGISWGGWQPGTGSSYNPAPTPTLTPTPEPTLTKTPTATPTSVPAKPKISSSMKLYYGGDATGKYTNSKYVTVWNKTGYTVEFKSENRKVARVGKKKGLVTAAGVGTTKITATFTNKRTKEVIVRECKVTVKRNAADVSITAYSKKKLQNLTVGETFQTNAYRIDSDGKRVWSGKTKLTDGLRFTSSDKSVFKVGWTKGKITAVGAGEAVLRVWAVQSEGATYNEEGKVVKYKATTKVRRFKVIVREAE